MLVAARAEIQAYLKTGIDGFFTYDPAVGRAAVNGFKPRPLRLAATWRAAASTVQPSTRSSASRYLAAVWLDAPPAAGRGAGAVLFQGWPLTVAVSSQSRRNCLSKLGGLLPSA